MRGRGSIDSSRNCHCRLASSYRPNESELVGIFKRKSPETEINDWDLTFFAGSKANEFQAVAWVVFADSQVNPLKSSLGGLCAPDGRHLPAVPRGVVR